jgi:exonuclease VII large subunit
MYSQEEKDKMAMKNATIDKFAARGDGEKLNRGDRMVARGERKVDRATAQLGSKLEKEANQEQKQLERKEKRAGEFPTLRQSERISAQKKAANEANKNKSIFNNDDEWTSKKIDRRYPELNTTDPYFGTRYTIENPDVTAAKNKTKKGERLVKKGTMLSAKINNRRKG